MTMAQGNEELLLTMGDSCSQRTWPRILFPETQGAGEQDLVLGQQVTHPIEFTLQG